MGEKHFEEFEPERLVKSTQRVRDLGEVFTPANIVDDMLDLLPDSIWSVHPTKNFLEPSVGNGNFVSAILSRKLSVVDDLYARGALPAGVSPESALFHALEALSSIYGVDISEDNIIGGSEGHEIACRPRLLEIMHRWFERGVPLQNEASFRAAAQWIVDHNMIIGNMLDRDGDGARTNREEIPFVEYEWRPNDLTVHLAVMPLGDIILKAEEEQSDVLTLFGSMGATALWSGSFLQLGDLQSNARVELTGKHISNSRGKR